MNGQMSLESPPTQAPRPGPTRFYPEMTLGEAKALLQTLVADGLECPCCEQYAKVYRRSIHAGMVRTLIAMWRKSETDFVYLPDIPQRSRDSAGLAYWSLIEEEKRVREDGGRAGWWRLTARGESWVKDRVLLPKYALVYDGRCIGHDMQVMVSIRDCLGTKFNYSELMYG